MSTEITYELHYSFNYLYTIYRLFALKPHEHRSTWCFHGAFVLQISKQVEQRQHSTKWILFLLNNYGNGGAVVPAFRYSVCSSIKNQWPEPQRCQTPWICSDVRMSNEVSLSVASLSCPHFVSKYEPAVRHFPCLSSKTFSSKTDYILWHSIQKPMLRRNLLSHLMAFIAEQAANLTDDVLAIIISINSISILQTEELRTNKLRAEYRTYLNSPGSRWCPTLEIMEELTWWGKQMLQRCNFPSSAPATLPLLPQY